MTGGNASRLLPLVKAIVGVGLILPIVAGGGQTMLAAFGYWPTIGARHFGLDAWRQLLELPGLATSLRLTIVTGLISTAIAFLLAIAFWASAGTFADRTRRAMAPVLGVPHAALAIGLAFLIAPSGWLARLASPWATGWTHPPDMVIVHDPFGIALIFGLVLKELPFLVLVIAGAVIQVPVRDQMMAGRALGYGRGSVWLAIILPQVYPQIRLAIYAVLAFSLTTVDMAVVLGPGNPPTLAVATLRWFNAPDMSLLLPASAAALLQTILAPLAVGSWWMTERVAVALGRVWVRRGNRSMMPDRLLAAASLLVTGLTAVGGFALIVLVLWSFSWRWTFPDAFPQTLSLKIWSDTARDWQRALGTTFGIAVASTTLAVLLAISWLEAADRRGGGPSPGMQAAIYFPLLLPQASFLFGLQVIMVSGGWGGTLLSVIWTHVLFVFPYVVLALGDAWRALDRRYARSAAALGRSRAAVLFHVKLPLLLRPILIAAAVGFSVSNAQYLSTLVVGAGRVGTLTLEAVALSSGADRRVVGAYATLQMLLPLVALAFAYIVPALLFSHRKQMAGGI